MGSSASIKIGKYEFLSSQSNLLPLLLIYNKWDQKIKKYSDDNDYMNTYEYITSVKQAKQCLDVSGIRISTAKTMFELSKKDLIDLFNNQLSNPIIIYNTTN